ncbi:hypothetical protein [Methylobacterium sp. ID0610]|uniref:hypothetical protein n=1 Tax=Methylobacterium carpenticola TaxID=3344827 RepID=UPI00367A9CD6
MLTLIRRRAAGLLLALAAALAGGASTAAEPVFPAAGSIGLVPPPGMIPAKGFGGFEHGSGAAIVIAEMPPEAYGPIVTKFTAEGLRPTGFVVRGESEALPVAGGEGRLLRGSQQAHGLTYAKWVAIVTGGSGTGIVTVQVPEGAAAQVPGPAVEAALRSIAFRAPQSITEQVAALPYTVGDFAGFRPVLVMAGSTLLLTEGPKGADPEGTQPMVVVAPSLGQATGGAGQESAIARKALGSLPQVKDLAVTGEERAARGTGVVVTLRGSGKDAQSGRAIRVVQTMVFDARGSLRVVGTAAADRPGAIARAERVAASIAFR